MEKTTMEVGADGVAVIAFTNPPVNLLSSDLILGSFKEKYEQALRRDDVKAIVFTGSNGKFSGGFDVTTFVGRRKGEGPKPGYISIDVLTDIFEAAKKPSVAAIDGVAFGGALEIAMVQAAVMLTPDDIASLLTLSDLPCTHLYFYCSTRPA